MGAGVENNALASGVCDQVSCGAIRCGNSLSLIESTVWRWDMNFAILFIPLNDLHSGVSSPKAPVWLRA